MRLLVHALLLLPLAAPSPSGAPEALAREPLPRIVVLQASRLEPFDRARRALAEQLEDEAEVIVEELDLAQGDGTAAVESHRPDVLVAIGSEATSWAQRHTRDTPIVFAMVLNPVSSGLVPSMRRPGGRVTGASLDISAERQFRALRQVIGAERLAVLYNPSFTGPLVREATRAAGALGLELVPIAIDSPKQLEGALERVDGSFDALWSVADPTVFGQTTTRRILLYTLERGVPFVGLSEQYVRAGAFLAFTSSYEENGRLAAEQVRRILAGASAGSLPITTPVDVEVVYNPRTAAHLDLELPDLPSLRLRSAE